MNTIDIILLILLSLCCTILILNYTRSRRKKIQKIILPPLEKLKQKEPSALEEGLKKTREGFIGKLQSLFTGSMLDPSLIQKLEEILLTSDVGVKTTSMLLADIQKKITEEKNIPASAYQIFLQEKIQEILTFNKKNAPIPSAKPIVIMVVGVNGSGKTTTIGKLAHSYHTHGKKVLLAAGDTYRAAAIEQLEIWAKKTNVDIIKKDPGTDPSSILFDAMKEATQKNYDVLIADTAGRLHTNLNLMEQLKKCKRVIQKFNPEAPHETVLILDATMGQNAINQAREFNAALGLTGIILTKLDGTAKGGVIIGIAHELKIPINYIGIGEQLEHLKPFNPHEFTQALFGSPPGNAR